MRNLAARLGLALLLVGMSTAATAQDVRYSWFDIAFGVQDIGQSGSQTDVGLGQTVDVDTSDGSGIRFRGSVGTWKNLFGYFDFQSSDISVDALVTNNQGQFAANDEFDYTSVRGGIGMRWPLKDNIDLYGLATLDSTDFDFGSFAGEDFDADDKDIGATIGVRALLGESWEVRAHARYTGVGAVDFTAGELSEDTLFGVGFSYELIRGLSLTGDFETGEFSSFNVGFRLDLDED